MNHFERKLFLTTPQHLTQQMQTPAQGSQDDNYGSLLHTLADILDNSETNEVQENENADEVIGKIMNLVNKMQDEEAGVAPGPADTPQSVPSGAATPPVVSFFFLLHIGHNQPVTVVKQLTNCHRRFNDFGRVFCTRMT